MDTATVVIVLSQYRMYHGWTVVHREAVTVDHDRPQWSAERIRRAIDRLQGRYLDAMLDLEEVS